MTSLARPGSARVVPPNGRICFCKRHSRLRGTPHPARAQMSLPHTAALAAAIGPAAAAGFALSVADYKRSLRIRASSASRNSCIARSIHRSRLRPRPQRYRPASPSSWQTEASTPSSCRCPRAARLGPSAMMITSRALANRFTAHACDQIVEIAENLADLRRKSAPFRRRVALSAPRRVTGRARRAC